MKFFTNIDRLDTYGVEKVKKNSEILMFATRGTSYTRTELRAKFECLKVILSR